MNGAWSDGALACALFSLLCLALMVIIAMKNRKQPNRPLSAIRAQRLAVIRARLALSNALAVGGLAFTVYIGVTDGLGAALGTFAIVALIVSMATGDLLHKIGEV